MEKKKITKKEVMDAVKKHQHFLNKDCDDWVLMRADFSNCLIEDIELKKLDMMQVNFAGHDLCPEFSEDEEMNKLVAPLSSESIDLLIEFDQKSKRKESENEERR